MFAELLSLIKTLILTGALFFMAFLVLLSLPKSRLRAVGLEVAKYAAAALLVLLVPSPVDPIPDVLFPIGYVDDVGYLVGAFLAVKSARADRKQRLFELTCENAQLARDAGIELAEFEVKGGRS